MKKVFIYLFTIIITLSFSNLAGAQTKVSMDPNQFVFWFLIRAEVKKDRITKKPSYVIRTLSKTPKSGTIRQFDKDLWRNLNAGQNLVIGPFYEFSDATQAIRLYNQVAKHKNQTAEGDGDEIPALPDSIGNKECYFFMLKFTKSKRKGNFELGRQPARVQPGNFDTFQYTLWSNLIIPQLLIGPFPSQEEAEESKRRYRIEED